MSKCVRLNSMLLTATLLYLFSIAVNAQVIVVTGKINDSTHPRPLTGGVAIILNEKDSVLEDFQHIDHNNSFTLRASKPGAYILGILHPDFIDFVDKIDLKKDQLKSLGTIFLLSKAKMLEELIVRQNKSMFLRNDTMVYTLDSFQVRTGENVEDVLKRLPGIEIDKYGKIRVHNVLIAKVLVDGEEFFGSDPGITTKNLQADMVSEVEVFDKKSDQAAFTGIDDGVKNRTINLKLKANKKKGVFGKAEAGSGFSDRNRNVSQYQEGRYYVSGMLNLFKDKRKFSSYFISSNTGYLNLNWMDVGKFGDDSQGNGVYGGDENFNTSEGIPNNTNFGIHYNNKFFQETNTLNASFNSANINTYGGKISKIKNFTPDSSWTTNASNTFTSQVGKQVLNITNEIFIDSANTIKVRLKGSQTNTDRKVEFDVENVSDLINEKINHNRRSLSERVRVNNEDIYAIWMHKTKKPFRTVSIAIGTTRNDKSSEGYFLANTEFYSSNAVDSTLAVDQKQTVIYGVTNLNGKVAFTDKIAKDVFIEASMEFYNIARANKRDIRDVDANGKYLLVNNTLSNDYQFNEQSLAPGLSLRLVKKKFNLNASNNIAFSTYRQFDKSSNKRLYYNFTNLSPRIGFLFKQHSSLNYSLNYRGFATPPTLEQLQPTVINIDPLNVFVGNQALRPSFSHNIDLGLNSFKLLAGRYLYVTASGGIVRNALVPLSLIKQSVRTTQIVNGNGVNNLSLIVSYSRTVKPIDVNVGIDPSFSLFHYLDFIGGANGIIYHNITTNSNYRLTFSLTKSKAKKYNFILRPYFGYVKAKSTSSTIARSNYNTAGCFAYVNINLMKSLLFNTTVTADLRERDPRFDKQSSFLFADAFLQQNLMKEKFQIKLSVRDIFNQQTGYERNFSSSRFVESNYFILKRMYLLGIAWNFSKSNE